MLSKREREEMLTDGRSIRRRKEFAQAERISWGDLDSLDEFIQFLMSLQRIFSPFVISRKETITGLNKL